MALDRGKSSSTASAWVNAEEILTNGDENGEVKDRVRHQLPELDVVGKKEAAEKLVTWERQSRIERQRTS
jgi:hypothetical protein